MKKRPVIGVLALQGCAEPHRFHIEGNGGEFRAVRLAKDFTDLDGLILPGGESTTMLKLLKEFSVEETLREVFDSVPVWGVCAGAILMAQNVENPAQQSFGLIEMTVKRNAYGRQTESFNETIGGCPGSFIRAPLIVSHSHGVEVLGALGGQPVWVRQGRHMATTFHPELVTTKPSPIHGYFMKMVNAAVPGGTT